MRHLRVIAISLVIAIAGMMFVSPASSQVTIRLKSAQRSRHYGYYHPRHVAYHPRHVVYYHRHVVYHHRNEGGRVHVNVR
jgi:hypothetical protein